MSVAASGLVRAASQRKQRSTTGRLASRLVPPPLRGADGLPKVLAQGSVMTSAVSVGTSCLVRDARRRAAPIQRLTRGPRPGR